MVLYVVSEKWGGPSHPISHIPTPKQKQSINQEWHSLFCTQASCLCLVFFFSTSKLRSWKSHTSIRISPQTNVIYPHGALLQQTPQQRDKNQLWFTTPSSLRATSTPTKNPTTPTSLSLLCSKPRPFSFHRPFIIIRWPVTNSGQTILRHQSALHAGEGTGEGSIRDHSSLYREDHWKEIRLQVHSKAEANQKEANWWCQEGNSDPATPLGSTQHRWVQGCLRGLAECAFGDGVMFGWRAFRSHHCKG